MFAEISLILKKSYGNEKPNAINAQYRTKIQDIIKHSIVQRIVKNDFSKTFGFIYFFQNFPGMEIVSKIPWLLQGFHDRIYISLYQTKM